MVHYSSIIGLGFFAHSVHLFCIIPTCNAVAFYICALNDYLLTYLLTYLGYLLSFAESLVQSSISTVFS